MTAVMAELRKRRRALKARRAFTLEGSVKGDVAQIERELEEVRELLGVADLREECLAEEENDMNHLSVFHTYGEYMELREEKGMDGIAFAWGVGVYALKKWVKEEEMKMVQTKEEVTTIAELEAQVASLQEQLHGYESHANGLQMALDATEQQLQVRTTDLIEVQKELAACRKQFVEVSAKERTLSTLVRRQEEEIKQFMSELDEYATLLGEKERQYDVLKQVAKPLLEQLLETL